jgi:hypothetical protein
VPESTRPSPPKAFESSAPHATAPQVGYVGPSAAPSPPPALAIGRANVPSTEVSSLDRTALVAGGMVIAFVALMALAAMWLIHRRYGDRLVR